MGLRAPFVEFLLIASTISMRSDIIDTDPQHHTNYARGRGTFTTGIRKGRQGKPQWQTGLLPRL
jgi:hypothetical protein